MLSRKTSTDEISLPPLNLYYTAMGQSQSGYWHTERQVEKQNDPKHLRMPNF